MDAYAAAHPEVQYSNARRGLHNDAQRGGVPAPDDSSDGVRAN